MKSVTVKGGLFFIVATYSGPSLLPRVYYINSVQLPYDFYTCYLDSYDVGNQQ